MEKLINEISKPILDVSSKTLKLEAEYMKTKEKIQQEMNSLKFEGTL